MFDPQRALNKHLTCQEMYRIRLLLKMECYRIYNKKKVLSRKLLRKRCVIVKNNGSGHDHIEGYQLDGGSV